MKKRTFLIKALAIVVFLSVLLINAGSLRCEPQFDGLSKTHSQANREQRIPTKSGGDQDLQNEKSERFKVMEWLIIQNLMKQYAKMETEEDLEDNLN